MNKLVEKSFRDCIKKERNTFFDTPFKFTYDVFCRLGFDKKDCSFFMDNASQFIIDMRKACWEEYTPLELEFTKKMLKKLINEEEIKSLTPVEAIEKFSSDNAGSIYDLSLSNTQSRRSRAGKEFETILLLLLVGAKIPVDTQSSLGKKFFHEKHIGKLVDFIVPGAVYYQINKHDTFLISAKTTLRERWQEVPEEIQRTGIKEIFLPTLDDSFSNETLEILYDANVRVVTTRENKENNYKSNNKILTFEEMLKEVGKEKSRWNQQKLPQDEAWNLRQHLHEQVEKYNGYSFITDYLNYQSTELEKRFESY